MGKHLHELFDWPGPMTHRQSRAWAAWWEIDQNRPSRADHYAMQTACQVTRAGAKVPKSIKLADFRLQFGTVAAKPVKPKFVVTKDDIARIGRERLLAKLQPKPKPVPPFPTPKGG